ncbi:MAG: hypothetical protein LBR62_01655, partial [Puniceicoccales bacterium]|nr:hypothetical protein [Puniceicoccales bacterium]
MTKHLEKSGSIWRIGGHYLRSHRRLFFLALFSGIVYGAAGGFGIPVIFQTVFKKIFESPHTPHTSWQIGGIVLGIPGIFLARGLFGFLSTCWMTRCGLEILKGLRNDVFTHLQRLSLRYFDAHTSGDLINRVVNDPRALQDLILEMATEL